MTCADVRDLIPAHALDALDDREASDLERHLRTCRSCQAQLATFRETACHLALTVPPASPSPDLRRRILNAASEVSERPAPGIAWWRGWWASFARLSPAVAAAALLISLGSALWAANAQISFDRQVAANRLLAERLASRDQMLAVLLAPGAEMRELRAEATAPGARAVLFVNAQSPTALLSAADLPPLPADRVYQLWLIQDGRRTSGGIFTVDANGHSRLEISAPQPLGAYHGVGVTVEPGGGSPAPTGPRVLAGTL